MGMAKKLEKMRIPGFRSGKKWKMVVAIIGYPLIFSVLLSIVVISMGWGPETTSPDMDGSAAVATPTGQKTSDLQNELLAEARECYKKGWWEKAINLTDQALKITPNNTEALSLKGEILVRKAGQSIANPTNLSDKCYPVNREQLISEGLQLLTKATSLSPKSNRVWFRYANALNELKRFDESLEAYDKALAIEPDDTAALNNKGLVLYRLGRNDEALWVFEDAVYLNPTNNVLLENYQMVAGHYPPVVENGVILTVLNVDSYGDKGYKVKVEVEYIGTGTHYTNPLFFEAVDEGGNVYTLSDSTFGQHIKTYPSANLNYGEKVTGEVVLSITSFKNTLVKIKYNSHDVWLVAYV